MRILSFIFASMLCIVTSIFAQEQCLLIDDFEGPLSGGAEGTVDFGAGNGSSVEVSASAEIKNTASQSLKVNFDAVAGGYIFVARGFGLDAKNADWLVKPEDIDWSKYVAFAFYMYGSESAAPIALDIKDSGGEIWRYMFEDSFQGWQKISCPLSEFSARRDWQPETADVNDVMDYPIKSYQFEPRPEAKSTIYFDTVTLE